MVLKLNFWSYFLLGFICFLIGAILLNPAIYIQSTEKGILLWAQHVLPALFPFLFLTKILTNLNIVQKISKWGQPITQKLFGCPGISNYVFLMSLISGYPVGAKLTAELCKNKAITSNDAQRMCSFCSTSGPIFIVGTVGATMFGNTKIGFIILLCHILGAFLNGIVFRFYKKNDRKAQIYVKNERKIDNILSETIYDSVISVLIVGGYIALFYLFVDILKNYYVLTFLEQFLSILFSIFKIPQGVSIGLISGIVEITRGCYNLALLNDKFWSIIFATGIISWGGLSTHLQSLTFLKQCNIKTGLYFLQKTMQALLSMLICFLVLLIFGI